MKSALAVVILVVLIVVVGVSVSKTETISLEDQNMDIVRLALFALKECDWASLADLHSPDFIHHSPDHEDPVTWDDYELACRIVRSRIPDLRFRIVDIFASKDKVAVRCIWEYRNDSYQFKRHYPHGIARGSGIDIIRIENGKIIEEWGESDPAPIKKFCRIYKFLDHDK